MRRVLSLDDDIERDVEPLVGPFDPEAWTDKPTMRSHASGLLRTIMATAASDGKIGANPCAIRGAGTAKRVHKVKPLAVAWTTADRPLASCRRLGHRLCIRNVGWDSNP